MPNRNKKGGSGFIKSRRVRKNDSFTSRYGMTRTAWAKLKKEDPTRAHEIKMKIQANDYKPKKK